MKNEHTMEEIMRSILSDIEQGITGEMPTGFKQVDELIGGLNHGQLMYLASRPGQGKTALGMNIAANIAQSNAVLYFSFDLNVDGFGRRIISAKTRTLIATVNKWEKEDFFRAGDQIKKATESMDLTLMSNNLSDSVSEIRRRCELIQQDKTIDLVVIDYFELLEKENALKDIKILAKELDIAVLVLGQISRSMEFRENKSPVNMDIKNDAEYYADVIAMLYSEETYLPETDKKGVTEFIVSKNRNGHCGSTYLKKKFEYVSFSKEESLTPKDTEVVVNISGIDKFI